MAARTLNGEPLVPGVNVDKVDVGAGLVKLAELGYHRFQHIWEVDYNLRRWARGEEGEADRSMSRSLSGVTYEAWRMVLAAAIAAGERA